MVLVSKYGSLFHLELDETIIKGEDKIARDFEVFYKGKKISNVTAVVLYSKWKDEK